MIRSLESLALDGDFNREDYGDKAVGLAELLVDIKEQKFECVKPYGYVATSKDNNDGDLRNAFDDLASRIKTLVDKRKVGGLFLRSSGFKEKSGVNTSIPVLYDVNDDASSWKRFKEAFETVKFDSRKEGDKLKPVLMQVLQGEISYTDTAYRSLGKFSWPKWPDFKNSTRGEWNTVSSKIYESVVEAMGDARIKFPGYGNFPRIIFDLLNNKGVKIGSLGFDSKKSLRETIVDSYLDIYHEQKKDEEFRIFLDEKGRVVNMNGVVADTGSEISISVMDVPSNPVIGRTNVGFVARSHDDLDPERASIRVARGLTSYLVKGLPPLMIDRPKGMFIYYFDQNTGRRLDVVNLGHDFRKASMYHYYQSHDEVFSITEGKVIAVRDFEGKFNHRMGDSELLTIANFYSDKRGMPVEIEGAYINKKLNIWQVTDSPIPEEKISKLSVIPEDKIVYRNGHGRGAILYRGDLVILEDKTVDVPKDKLIIGFDQSVASRNRFLYIASEESVKRDAGRNLQFIESHLAGFACQLTFEAGIGGRQGGVYYVNYKDEFLSDINDFVVDRGRLKVIPDVCVEACRGGMQIYKI